MMRVDTATFVVLAMLGAGCTSTPGVPEPERAASALNGQPPIDFPTVDDNIRHDTLLIQTTFDLGDGTFVMVASNVEETFEGLRLYRYRPKADSSAELLAVSTPAYDSWTMLPTFFGRDSSNTHALWILANFGEKESWGQKLIRLEDGFTDKGFLDVALPDRVMEDDTLRLKRRNIAPFMRYEEHRDTLFFHFACDSVFLYDDLAGKLDQVIAARRVRYSYHPTEGLVLWLDGRKRPVKQTA